jgi:hypothetical protein
LAVSGTKLPASRKAARLISATPPRQRQIKSGIKPMME